MIIFVIVVDQILLAKIVKYKQHASHNHARMVDIVILSKTKRTLRVLAEQVKL
jgi:hypothetical protein